MKLITALQVFCISWAFGIGAQANSIALEGRDSDTEFAIAKRSQEKILDQAHALLSTPIPDMGVICWPQGFAGADEQSTLYNIIKLAHHSDPKASFVSPAKSCTIKTCRNQAAVILCNDNDFPIRTKAQPLGYLAWRIINDNKCTNQDSRTCGQQFSKGGWNVILREVSKEECDSGILAWDKKENHDRH